MKKRSCLKMDARRCFFSWRFLGVIIAIVIICILSMSESWGQIFSGEFQDTISSADQLNKMLYFDRFKPLLIVALAAVYGSSFAEDWNHRYFRFIFSRSSLKRYAVSKIIITIAGVVLAAIFGFVLFGIVLYPWIRIGGIEGVFDATLSFSDFPELLIGPMPALYLVLQGWNFGLSASCMALAGLWMTVKKPNSFLGVGGPFFVFYFVYAVSLWLLPDYLDYMRVSSFVDVGFFKDNLVLKLLYHTGYLAICNLIPAIGFYCSLRKRWKDGNL